MSNTNTGGPAFPYGTAYAGMTLRDYFAAKAMQSLLRGANPRDGQWHIESKAAYEIADAMLKAREA